MAITNGLKISQLPSVSDFQSTDFIPISRGNVTRRMPGQALVNRFVVNNRYETNIISTGGRNININHNFETFLVNVFVYEIIGTAPNIDYQIVYPTVTLLTVNTVRLTFRTPPPNNKYRVLITR
jgi:hypothetical protein